MYLLIPSRLRELNAKRNLVQRRRLEVGKICRARQWQLRIVDRTCTYLMIAD
jgi:hypothetical protein